MSDTANAQFSGDALSDTSARHAAVQPADETTTAWTGWVVFAAVMLILIGAFHALEGFIALFDPGYYTVTPNGLAVEVDYTAWGWGHLLLSALIILTGAGLLAGQMWARVVAIVLAGLSTLVNLGFLAAYPAWSTLVIAFDVVVIYALAVHGGEMKAYRD